MSALTREADIDRHFLDVCLVPEADITRSVLHLGSGAYATCPAGPSRPITLSATNGNGPQPYRLRLSGDGRLRSLGLHLQAGRRHGHSGQPYPDGADVVLLSARYTLCPRDPYIRSRSGGVVGIARRRVCLHRALLFHPQPCRGLGQHQRVNLSHEFYRYRLSRDRLARRAADVHQDHRVRAGVACDLAADGCRTQRRSRVQRRTAALARTGRCRDARLRRVEFSSTPLGYGMALFRKRLRLRRRLFSCRLRTSLCISQTASLRPRQ